MMESPENKAGIVGVAPPALGEEGVVYAARRISILIATHSFGILHDSEGVRIASLDAGMETSVSNAGHNLYARSPNHVAPRFLGAIDWAGSRLM